MNDDSCGFVEGNIEVSLLVHGWVIELGASFRPRGLEGKYLWQSAISDCFQAHRSSIKAPPWHQQLISILLTPW